MRTVKHPMFILAMSFCVMLFSHTALSHDFGPPDAVPAKIVILDLNLEQDTSATAIVKSDSDLDHKTLSKQHTAVATHSSKRSLIGEAAIALGIVGSGDITLAFNYIGAGSGGYWLQRPS